MRPLRRLPGLRSLRARLLLAMVAIAIAAVGATAWLTSRTTAASVRGDLERTLEVDGLIYSELRTYGASYPSWDGVDGLVRDLAERTGRRIALTTRRGEPLVDSARLDGGAVPPLPEHPAALVDPLNLTLVYGGPGITGGGMHEVTTSVDGPDPYPLTAEEMAQRTAMARAASACMDAAGVENRVRLHDDVPPDIEYDDADEAASRVYDRCVDEDELYATGAAERAAITRADRELARCLDRRGVPYTTTTGAEGLPATEVDGDSVRASAAYTECMDSVLAETMADPALLYLGSGDRTGVGALVGGGARTAAAAGGVALLAVVVTVLMSRRLLHPVAALTAAARRMEGGTLAQRVDVRGDDELAGLARSFNAMADAVATNEEQRRQLVNDVAHELRTPLGNIRGYVEAAQDGLTPTDDRLLASLHEDAVLLQRLVDDLQTLALADARKLALHRKPVDLGELAAQVAEAHAARAGLCDIELVVEPSGDDGPLTVDADPGRLRQALANLVANALRYSAAGDTVTVRARRDGAGAVAEVVDTGAGIAPADLPHVFDRFWRADTSRSRETGGTGLGLAICRELVEAHGGTVTATSALGEGSTFAIRLPAR